MSKVQKIETIIANIGPNDRYRTFNEIGESIRFSDLHAPARLFR